MEAVKIFAIIVLGLAVASVLAIGILYGGSKLNNKEQKQHAESDTNSD